jgi:hypothetical protein
MAIINGQGRVGVRVTPGVPSYDTDALAFFTASGITDLTQKSAVNQLVLDLKSNSLWSKMKALYPIVGGNATAHSYNLINTSLYQLTLGSGWTHNSTGAIPNGTSAIALTGLIPDSVGMTVNDNHAMFYSGTSTGGGGSDQYEMGSGNNLATVLFSLFTRRSANTYGYDSGFYLNNRNAGFLSDGSGIFLGKVNSDLTSKIYRNGSLLSTKAITSQASLSPYQVYLGGFNEMNTTTYYSSKRIISVSLGLGLSDTDATNYTTCINTFNTTLGRNTY